MKLTMNWLRANATATSYDRGEEYEDAVNTKRLTTTTFETTAQWLLNIYPNEVFPLYCERVILFMGNSASDRSHYKSAVQMLKPVKEIKGKEQDIRAFSAELRMKYNRLPAFLDELKKGGF